MTVPPNLKVAFVLPLLCRSGAVRRFLHCSEELNRRKHAAFVITIEPGDLSFYKHDVPVLSVEEVGGLSFDEIVVENPLCFEAVKSLRSNTTRVWVWVTKIRQVKRRSLVDEYGAAVGWGELLLNNRALRQYFPDAILLEGGIGPQWHRRRLRVGVQPQKLNLDTIDLLKGLPITLVPIEDMPSDESIAATYRSIDYFLAWEYEHGWGNMAAEAVACGTPVVTNGMNVEPFGEFCIRLRDDDALKRFFCADPLWSFRYVNVVTRLLSLWRLPNHERDELRGASPERTLLILKKAERYLLNFERG